MCVCARARACVCVCVCVCAVYVYVSVCVHANMYKALSVDNSAQPVLLHSQLTDSDCVGDNGDTRARLMVGSVSVTITASSVYTLSKMSPRLTEAGQGCYLTFPTVLLFVLSTAEPLKFSVHNCDLDRNEDVPVVEFTYLIFTRMPGKSYRRRLRSLLLCLCDVFRALINSLVC